MCFFLMNIRQGNELDVYKKNWPKTVFSRQNVRGKRRRTFQIVIHNQPGVKGRLHVTSTVSRQ